MNCLARTAIASAAGLVGLSMGTSAAAANAPDQQGWWTTSPAAAATAPDVPADALLVEGGPAADNPTSFAALTFALAPGATTGDLTLKIAPNSGTVPNAAIHVCRLTSPLQPAQGGAIADAPKFDCSDAVNATLATDTIKLSTSSLIDANGQLAIAILPDTATDRLVFTKPDSSALAVTMPPPPSNDSFSSDTSPTPAADAPATFASPAASLDLPAADVSMPSPPPTVTTPTRTDVALEAAPSAPSSSGNDAASGLAVLVLLAAAAAAVLWFGAGATSSRSDPPLTDVEPS